MNLIILGSVAFDAIETPYGKTDKIIGGAGSYISLAASYLTDSLGLVSVVGEDFPEEYLNLLKSKKIDIEGIEIKENQKTFFWSGKYHSNMNKRDTLITELNVLADFKPKVPDAYKDADFLMLGNLCPDMQMMVLEQLNKRPKMIALDTMNFWIDQNPDKLKEVIKKTDLLIINDEEVKLLSNSDNLVKGAKEILKQGVKYIVVKKGEHGALLFGEDQIFSAPALPLESVFDPTGAGDTFAGGLIGYLASQNDTSFETIKTAVVVGSVLASFNVEKFGTEKIANLNSDMIKERFNKFVSLTSFATL